MADEDEFNDRYVFDDSLLPGGFRFPKEYLDIITAVQLPDLVPWGFLATREKSARFWLSTLQSQYPARLLIPFAQRGDWSDTLAAFDGSDKSGHPKVFHIHAYTEPGWEQRGTWNSFQDWLAQAHADSVEFKADDE